MKMFSFPSRMCVLLRKRVRSEEARGMATLKAISIRLKSVKNIQKITQSMKMVSAAKYSRAERELKQAKPLGKGAMRFYEKAEMEKVEAELPAWARGEGKILYVAVTSDRGLCGAVHTSVARLIRNALGEPSDKARIVCVGDKGRSLLQRHFARSFLFVCQEVGRLPPTFRDASVITNEILRSEFQFEKARIVYNRFRSVVSNATEEIHLYSLNKILSSKMGSYEKVDEETFLSFLEFYTAALIYYAMKEGACSEQSSRMTAMDNASKNAGDMIGKLTLTFNRTRQAVITRELIEIISGASAL